MSTNRNRGQVVNQNPDLRDHLPPFEAWDRINSLANDRAMHENIRRMEHDTIHGPPGPWKYTAFLRQVIWLKGFKLEKLRKYDGKENPESWIRIYEIVVSSVHGDERVMANYLPVLLDSTGYQWLLSLLALLNATTRNRVLIYSQQ